MGTFKHLPPWPRLLLLVLLGASPGWSITSSSSRWKDELAEVTSGRQPWVFPTSVQDGSPLKVEPTIHPQEEREDSQEDLDDVRGDDFPAKQVEALAASLDPHFSYTNNLAPYYYDLEPTKSEAGSGRIESTQGEGDRVPRARTPGPETTAQSAVERKTEPDIQEIITGFVKLLNGGGPSAQPPVRRRINNRGPPRISDLPPFVLDPLVPPPPPTKEPPPYPFEKPLHKVVIKPFVTGVPVPEQIVPTKPPKTTSKPLLKPTPVKQDAKKTVKPLGVMPALQLTPPSPVPSLDPVNLTTSEPTTEAPEAETSPSTSTTSTTSTTTTTTTPPSTTTDTPKLNLTQLFPNTSFPSPNNTAPEVPSLAPVLLSPTPSLESSMLDLPSSKEPHKPTSWDQPTSTKPYKGYSARPGIVLDDPEYKPGGARPVITAAAPSRGQIFDVTVSAIQGPQGASGTPHIYPVELEGVNLPGEVSVITKAQAGQHYVSIDGKRTYINLFGSSTPSIKPTETVKSTPGTYSVHEPVKSVPRPPSVRRPPPPVRIDTCIVGDWSTCDSEQHETCRTEHGVSSCHCSPAYSRLSHRQPCKRIVSLFTAINVEKLYEQKLTWNDKFTDSDSQEYLQLEYEAVRAMESALSMTPFSDAYMGSKLNNIYTPGGGHVLVNMTLELESSGETQRPQVRQEIERHLLAAIRRRNFNLGTSALWASQANTVSHLQDLDECSSSDLNDCFIGGECSNTFGSFECTCPMGYKDEFVNNPHKAGRRCETCSTDYCNHRGTCSYNPAGQPQCACTGNYYGSQCEVDGEVLGVAIGASVAAIVIILSTLACLCMWSRKWNREQKAVGLGSPVFGYMPTGGSTVKTPGIGGPTYHVSMEDRLRWAQIADAMATNHYAPEPVGVARPPSAMFGYGTLPVAPLPLPRLGLRPGSVHNLRQESSSEEEDRADLLRRDFQVPRPKSRTSIANQSGIYYDVDYDEQQDQLSTMKHPPIPLSTYTMGRAHYYRN